MRAVNRKLLRDIMSHKGQVAAISVVIGSGIMVLILFATILDAINLSKDKFYQSHNFAHVFSEVKRAPETLTARISQIPGINVVEKRIQAPLRIDVQGFKDPIQGMIYSIPEGRQPGLNRLYLRQGSLPEPGYSNQVVVSEPFAQAHNLMPGHTLQAIIKGRLETLTITGVALSPEHVYQLGPADLIPDYQRYGLFWMNRRALAGAFGMQGAFNSVAVTVQSGADLKTVINDLDLILKPYGGTGAIERKDQISNRFLQEEINQLKIMAVVLPAIFLGVSAFLLNILMNRIVRTQRQQIAVLKAFGYSNLDINLHYIALTCLIAAIGAILGVALGAWAADSIAGLYAEYFRFPEMSFRLQAGTIVMAVAIAFTTGILGTFKGVMNAARQPPAQAMRPPAPERFSKGIIEKSFMGRLLDQPGKIILRNISRHRFKTSMSMLGIALSGSLLLLGTYQFGSVNHMLDIQYRFIQKMDIQLFFNDQVSQKARAELLAMPGVLYVETFRSVPIRLSHGQNSYRTSITGLEPKPQLRAVLGADLKQVDLPPQGLVITDYLADYLKVVPGDLLNVEIMEGNRRTLDLELAGTVDEPIGINAYMNIQALNRIMREGPAISGAWLLTDRSEHSELYARLWDIPAVAGVGLVSRVEANIREYIEDTVLIFMGVLLIMAGSITFAVIYNNARIAFAERIRELATLRVLGFTRAEVSWILIGEIALITILSIPLGWAIGIGFAHLLNLAMSTDLFRLPIILTPKIFAFSAGGVLLASTLSLILISRRLKRLDMVVALKTE